ncbi:MAG: tetratricopeptide repeat protein [bacterium]|nr:tetratricopeptide repeat protein [bacterium]
MKRTFSFLILVLACASLAMAGMELTSAKIYRKQNEIAKAMEFYDQAVAKEPDNAEAVYERGELLGIIAMDPAQIGVRKKIAGDVDDPQMVVLDRMVKDFDAVRVMATGGDKKAQKYEKKIKTISDEYWWEFYSKAVAADSAYRAMEAAGSMENANAVVDQGLKSALVAIKIDPKHWSSRFVFAQLRGFQAKDDGFVAAWHEAMTALDSSDMKTKEPENYKHNHYYAHLQLIQNYYAQENYAKTLEVADEMLADDPGSVEAVQYKAFALATMASDEKRSATERDSLKRVALGALDNAKTSNPDDENILFYIGQFNLQLADTAAAMTAFDNFLVRVPGDRDVLFTQGLIYLEGSAKYGNLDKAVEKFGAIKDAYPEDGPAWINYGIALIRQGKTSEGSDAVKKGESLPGK